MPLSIDTRRHESATRRMAWTDVDELTRNQPSVFHPKFRPGHDFAAEETTCGDNTPQPRFCCRHLDVYYGEKPSLHEVNLNIGRHEVLALIGPTGSGKSTFLRCLNRMNDIIVGCRVNGQILLDGQDIYADEMDVVTLRGKVGMVFQKPNPFAKSILENVAYGPRIHGLASDREELWTMVEKALRRCGLWKEVKNCLGSLGTSLSDGQQQLLCIARAIAVNPEVILMDEPCSALDPISTAKIEQLIDDMREQCAIVIVTHWIRQAARISHRTAYFHRGHLIEVADTSRLFTQPRHPLTKAYISGRLG